MSASCAHTLTSSWKAIQLFEDEGGVPVLPWDLELVPQEPEDSDDECEGEGGP